MINFSEILCSEFASKFDTANTITLATAIERLTSGYYQQALDFQQQLEAKGLEIGSEAYREAKKELKRQMAIPTLVLSATIREGAHRSDSAIERMSGLVVHDFDLVDQHRADFTLFKHHVRQYPFVAYCGRSLSGTGFFTISWTNLTEPAQYKPTYAAIAERFGADGWASDSNASSLSNYRFASFDPEPYINPQALPYPHAEADTRKPYVAPTFNVPTDDEVMADIERILTQNPTAMISDDRTDWIRVGLAFANDFGESGRPLFHHFSSLSSKYDAQECDKKYSELLRTNRGALHYQTFYFLCEKYGVDM